MSDDRFLVLSIDGGGIRGVIPALLLEDLGQSVLDRADLYTGTSTGSLIALGLAGGVSIQKIANLYQSQTACQKIFTPFVDDRLSADERQVLEEARQHALQALSEASLSAEARSYWQAILSILEQLLFPLYSTSGLAELLGESFPNLTLDQVWNQRQKHVLVATFWINAALQGQRQWQATAMHNLGDLPLPGSFGGVKLADAMMSSGAAPLYFEPHTVSNDLFIDGGVFANNPSTLALTASIAAGLVGGSGVPLDRVFLLSLGTGFNRASYPPSSSILPPYGIAGWLWPKATATAPRFPLLGAMFDGVSQTDDFQARMTLGPDNYRRGNLDLGADQISLDDCAAVPTMVQLTQDYIQGSEWQEIKGWVQANFGG